MEQECLVQSQPSPSPQLQTPPLEPRTGPLLPLFQTINGTTAEYTSGFNSYPLIPLIVLGLSLTVICIPLLAFFVWPYLQTVFSLEWVKILLGVTLLLLGIPFLFRWWSYVLKDTCFASNC